MGMNIEKCLDIVKEIWHFRVEDDLDWKFCAGVWNNNTDESLSPEQIKRAFLNYFKVTCGIAPYSKCPICGNKLLPRESRYGKFVGCSDYPKCDFIATKTKPYNSKSK